MTRNERTPTSAPTTRAPSGHSLAWSIAALGTGLEALGLVIMAVTAMHSAATGAASTTTRAVTEAVMLLVLAAGVGLLAVNLVRRRSLAKTPTLLWNGILVPVAFSLADGGARGLGIATGVVAVVTFVAALGVPRYDPDETASQDVL